MVSEKQRLEQAGQQEIVKRFRSGEISKQKASDLLAALKESIFRRSEAGSVPIDPALKTEAQRIAGFSPSFRRLFEAEQRRKAESQGERETQAQEISEDIIIQDTPITTREERRDIEQQIGSLATGGSFAFVDGRSKFIERPGVTQFIGESESAFRERQRSLGSGVLARQPELFQEVQEFREQQPIQQPIIQEPIKEDSIIQDVGDFLFGDLGRRFVGIGSKAPFGLQTGLPAITIQQLKREATQISPILGGVAGLIPETPGGLALTGGAVVLFPGLPKIIQLGISTTIATTQLPKVFDPTLPTEQRITSGIIGISATLGTAFQLVPFIKGGFARFSPKFKPVKTQSQGFKAIELDVGKQIGLVLEKAPAKTGVTSGVKLPKTSQLVRGGFGVRSSEKSLFLGKQDVATSQIGLFKKGQTILLEREFFVTPQDPFAKIPTTRLSRLGLGNLFKTQKGAKISFGLPKTPQIGIERGALVTRGGGGRSFKIGKGTELEAIKGAGAIITDVKKIGVTTIKLQKVDIFEFTTGKGGALKIPSSKLPSSKLPSSVLTSRVSGESTLAFAGITKDIFKSTKIKPSSLGRSFGRLPSAPTRPTAPAIRISLISPPRDPFSSISPSISTLGLTQISPPISPVISPPTTPRSPPISPPIFPPFSPPRRLRRPKEKGVKKKRIKKAKGRVSPSLTGIARFQFGGIVGKLPTGEGRFGVLPTQIRFVPNRRRLKKIRKIKRIDKRISVKRKSKRRKQKR